MLIHETRDKLKRRAFSGLRVFSVGAIAVAIVWSTTLVVDGWKANRAPASAGPIAAAPRLADVPSAPAMARVLAVVGTARHHVQLDRLTWDASLTVQAADRATALRQLSGKTKALRDFLGAHGVEAAELSIYPATCDPELDERSKPNGFVATQKLELQSTEVPRVLGALRELALNAELGAQLPEPSCTYSAVDKLQEELVAAAQADAREHATKDGGARLGPLVKTDPAGFGLEGNGSSLAACAHGSDAVATVNALYLLD